MSPTTITLPIRTDLDGVQRIGNTRVTLQSVIFDFQRGASAEEITHHFPATTIAEIYLVIGYYLQNRTEVEAYLAQEHTLHEQALGNTFPQDDLRARLVARLQEKQQS